jgi:hypothetical protein
MLFMSMYHSQILSTGLNAIRKLFAKNIVSRRLTLLSTDSGASGAFIWHKLHLFSYRNGLL